MPLLVILLVGAILPFKPSARAGQGINPLQVAREEQIWQVTARASKFSEQSSAYRFDSSGLWENESTVEGIVYSLESRVDLNERIGLEGSLSFVSSTVHSDQLNLWTGQTSTETSTEGALGDPCLSVLFELWRNSHYETKLFLPLWGGPLKASLQWSKDPVMITPELTFDGNVLGGHLGLSFVANQDVALIGHASLQRDERASIDLKGGVVYRWGKYRGVQVLAGLKEDSTRRAYLEFGLTYGEEIT